MFFPLALSRRTYFLAHKLDDTKNHEQACFSKPLQIYTINIQKYMLTGLILKDEVSAERPMGSCVPTQCAGHHAGMGTVNLEPACSPRICCCFSLAARVPSAHLSQCWRHDKGTKRLWLGFRRLKCHLPLCSRHL